MVVVVEGRGLHTGAPARVRLERRDGPIALNGARLDELRVVDTERSTTVAAAGARVRTVEHLFAALAGMNARAGIALEVDGPEVPLLDGGAVRWCEAIAELGVAAGEASLRVARDGVVEIGASKFAFEVGARVEVEVEIEIEIQIDKRARWGGDAHDFRARIAPARTFALAREVDELVARGLASHVDRESVVVLAHDAILSAGRPFSADEPARHKLLDLVGDLYTYGGPPRGRVRAFRPGHGATHAAVSRALALGILRADTGASSPST